jgi:glucose/arabinose dehydrogenase
MVELSARYDERGLLGMAFHPSFKSNGRFFVYYSAPLREGAEGNHTSHISEFAVSAEDPDTADPDSERIVLQVDEPQSNHNGGQLAFGPDGFLYISLGDGGGANDSGPGHAATGNGQDVSTLLGKILRLDVDGAALYAIPPDNPFVDQDGRDEIFAFGFRNPFRFSFDAGGAHELFVGDVGQGNWEEVDIVSSGGNYGWNLREGAHNFPPGDTGTPRARDAAGRPLIDPVVEYRNAGAGGVGIAVIGGYVYRGSGVPGLQGKYIFGDLSASFSTPAGRLFTATRPAQPGGAWTMQELEINSAGGRLNAFVKGFGQDSAGELYVLVSGNIGPSGTTGRVYQLVP